MLAGVSQELADLCATSPALAELRPLPVADPEPLHIFLIWLYRFPIKTTDQKGLVQGWKFGAKFKIASFQNDVMRRLVGLLRSDSVRAIAVLDAYNESEPAVRCDLHRKAFVAQIFYDVASFSGSLGRMLTVEEYTASGLSDNAEYKDDIANAVSSGADFLDLEAGGPDIEDLLIKQ